jgi:hypothetical protein
VISRVLVRIAAILLGAAALLVASAPAARAGAPSVAVQPSSPAPIDIVKFARLISARDHIHFRRIVAADIDRDGDLDVVAMTERGFLVWKNDGAGHLKQETPRHQPSLAGRLPERTWEGDQSRREESVKDDLPSSSDLGIRAHAPPPLVLRARTAVPRFDYRDAPFGCCSPRAPPLQVKS